MIDLLIEDPTAVGGWLSLENTPGLRLGADTFATSQQTLKRVTASNAYVPGTFTVRATPENITESIVVLITEGDMPVRRQKSDYLVDLFTRVNYQLMLVMGEVREIMTGQAADYSINNQREFLHAGLTQINFSVPILPTRRLVEQQ